MEERLTGAGGEILAHVANRVATVTLNRPNALNALTLDMVASLAEWLEKWRNDAGVRSIVLRGAGPRAFCAGGDIRWLREGMIAGSGAPLEFYAKEYELDFRIHTYPKTIVAIMNGIVMGGGMGLSQGAGLRIVGERTRMAMPETAIGHVLDVGASWFLSRLPGRLGAYLGLTGTTIGAADAVYCGLADVDTSTEPSPAELPSQRAAIDEHFGHATVEAIVASLKGESRPAFRDWAARTASALAQRSPTLLAVTLEQLRRGAAMSLAECFRMELAMMQACIEHGDVMEGIRAIVVDKDNNARWKPAASAGSFFKPRWDPARHPLAHLQ